MPGSSGDDQHLEVAVRDDEVAQPPAVDVAAAAREGEQGWVDQQFLVQVAAAAGRVLQIRPRSHLWLLTVSGSDIANVGRYGKDIVVQIVHRLPSTGRHRLVPGRGDMTPTTRHTIVFPPLPRTDGTRHRGPEDVMACSRPLIGWIRPTCWATISSSVPVVVPNSCEVMSSPGVRNPELGTQIG